MQASCQPCKNLYKKRVTQALGIVSGVASVACHFVSRHLVVVNLYQTMTFETELLSFYTFQLSGLATLVMNDTVLAPK